MFKRILVFCLVFILSLNVIGVLPTFAASKSEVQLIEDLGIIDLSEPTGLLPKGFTREDFAVALNKLDKNAPANFLRTGEEKKVYATDIEGNKNYNEIATLIAVGYMETDGEGQFNPSKPVTINDALKALVCSLGYDVLAERNGGTNAAYERIAQKIGLLKGVSIADREKLTSYEVAGLLANAMGVRFFSANGVYFGDTCFFDEWKLEKHTGKILANSNLGIATDRTSYKNVNIDDEIYYTELLVKDELVGSNVEYYVTDSDNGREVVSIYTKGTNNHITINAKDITAIFEKAKEIEITYNDDEEISISKNAYLLVNGKTISPTVEIFDAFKSGTVTFVDSEQDGRYDIAHMTLLVQGAIDTVNTKKETVSLKYDGKQINLKDTEVYEVYLNNKAAELSELTQGMTLGVACDSFKVSEGKVIYDFNTAEMVKLYASSKRAEGVVSQTTDEAAVIGEIKYQFGEGYYRLTDGGYITKLELNNYITAYLDTFGQIVYFDIDSDKSALKYGYLIATHLSSKPFEKGMKLRIMDTKGDKHVFSTGEKFILDGQKVDANSLTYSAGSETIDLSKRQVVRYWEEDGILRELDTEIIRAGIENEENSLNHAEEIKFDPYAADGTEKKLVRRVIDNYYALTTDCIIFLDEALLSDANPEDFKFSVKKQIGTEEKCYIEGYDPDENNMMGVAAIWSLYGATDATHTQDCLAGTEYGMVVEKITAAVNDEGIEGFRVYLAAHDRTASYFTRPDSLRLFTTGDTWEERDFFTVTSVPSENLLSTIKPGDVVRISVNSDNEIIYMEKNFDFTANKAKDEVPFADKDGQLWCYTKLEKVVDNYLLYTSGGTRMIGAKNPYFDSAPVYYVKSGKVEVLPITEVPCASKGNDVRVYMRYYNHNYIRDHIIYVFD